ncbi:uncharacterized protein LOC118748334 [Rhagoletis pomonella]|uniref:uncharacterized protein LOC118748334 n=1 Tax=Rhagoletis pomonella TaxID=28610 RepID=UPI00178099B9|nr:uncharacterized protein LOC118748334 [Rhagoletis pomonella]
MATNGTRQLIPNVIGYGLTPFVKKLLNNICNFYDEQDLIDVTFKLSNPTALIPAHRLILSAASPYFKDLFKSHKGLTPVIELNNIDSDTFELLIAEYTLQRAYCLERETHCVPLYEKLLEYEINNFMEAELKLQIPKYNCKMDRRYSNQLTQKGIQE